MICSSCRQDKGTYTIREEEKDSNGKLIRIKWKRICKGCGYEIDWGYDYP